MYFFIYLLFRLDDINDALVPLDGLRGEDDAAILSIDAVTERGAIVDSNSSMREIANVRNFAIGISPVK